MNGWLVLALGLSLGGNLALAYWLWQFDRDYRLIIATWRATAEQWRQAYLSGQSPLAFRGIPIPFDVDCPPPSSSSAESP